MSYIEKKICIYKDWEIKEVNNGKQNWYCAKRNYQDIDADTIEDLIDTINIIQNEYEERIKKRTRKKKRIRRKKS